MPQINPIALAVIRVLAGYSQAELSRQSNVSQSHISGLESGDKVASPLMLRKLADALGVPAAALLKNPSPAELAEAKAKLSKSVPLSKALSA